MAADIGAVPEMMKDYMPVADGESDASEAELIEAHWTRIWDARTAPRGAAEELLSAEEVALLDPVVSRLPGGARLLDGGCGLGLWTVAYAQRGFDVTGIDISRATIDTVQRLFPEQRFVVGDIRETGFPDAHFDAYFSWGTFEHFELGLGGPLREAFRVLKPGGYLVITVPYQNPRHLLRLRRDLAAWDEYYDSATGYRRPMRFYQWRLTQPELRREIDMHGFRTLTIRPMHKLQGLHRTVRFDLGLDPEATVGKIARRMLAPFVPASSVAHMIGAVAQKTSRPSAVIGAVAATRC